MRIFGLPIGATLLFVSALSLPAPALAQAQWVPTLLGTRANVRAMNRYGEVVGQWDNPSTNADPPFRWRAGTTTFLPTPAGRGVAADINDNGQIVGTVFANLSTGGRTVAAGWTNGQLREFGTLYPNNSGSSSALAINNSAQVVGWSNGPVETQNCGVVDAVRAFLWNSGSMEDLESLGDYIQCTGVAGARAEVISDGGVIAGDARSPLPNSTPNAAIFGGAEPQLLFPNGGGSVLGINALGVIVGGGATGGNGAYRYNGSASPLPDIPNSTSNVARAINDFGGDRRQLQRRRNDPPRDTLAAESHVWTSGRCAQHQRLRYLQQLVLRLGPRGHNERRGHDGDRAMRHVVSGHRLDSRRVHVPRASANSADVVDV